MKPHRILSAAEKYIKIMVPARSGSLFLISIALLGGERKRAPESHFISLGADLILRYLRKQHTALHLYPLVCKKMGRRRPTALEGYD